jgi:enoyl-CoA hydratase/carnithine racemase
MRDARAIRRADAGGYVSKMATDTFLEKSGEQSGWRDHFAVAVGKRAFYEQIDLDTAKAYDYTKEVMSQNAMSSDAQEGIGAFLEKRRPVWCGR